MKSSGSPPPPPDPTTTANAQSGANIQTAIANARLNRVNQQTPWGSITYTQGPNDANGVPTWTSNIALSPQQQALLEQQQGGQLTRAQMANQVLANSGSNITKPLDLTHLQSVYDPYSADHQWQPSPVSASQAAGPAPSMNAPSTQGSAPQSGQGMDPAMLAQIAAMLRGSQGNAPAAQLGGASPAASASAAPASSAGGDPFGAWGNLNSYIGTSKPDTSKLPPEIAAQLQDEVKVDEGGTQTHNYSFNENPWGGFKDSSGKVWVQVGDPNTNNAADGGIKDKSKVVYQPGAGYVTTPDNLNAYKTGGIDWRMVAIALGAGAAGTAAGLGGAAAGEGAAGSGLGAGTMTGAAGDESAGLLGTGSYAGAAAPTGVTSAAPGAFDAGGSTGFGGTTPLDASAAGNYAPVTDLSTQAKTPSMWQQMIENMQNGKGALGYGSNTTRAGGALLSALLRSGQSSGGKK